MKRKSAIALAAATLLSLLLVPASASAHDTARGCERDFLATVQRFDEVFLARDLPATISYYHEDATQVGVTGQVRTTKAQIENNFRGLFNFEFTATFPEIKRVVHRCSTAIIVVDFRLEIPALGYSDHFVNVLTFVRERGRWLIIADASTRIV